MDTGNFSYLCPDLFGIFRKSHRLQCPHCALFDFQNLLKNIRPYDPKNLRNALLVFEMSNALMDGNLSDALKALKSYIAQIPYDIISREEWKCKAKRESFYKLLLYMVFSMLNSVVDTEVKSILGRADVVIKTPKHIFVIELKVDDTIENALSQIDNKRYAIPYESDGREIIKCGVSISSERRNIDHWRSTDNDGNIIDNY